MKLGFIGVGTIASAMVDGLRAAGEEGAILLSPRNAQSAAGLAARHRNVHVAQTNQAVLDGSDLVVLAVRPQIVAEVLADLHFRPDHHVLSLVATLSLAGIQALTAPAARVTRAVPLPAVAIRQGPTAMFPPDDRLRQIFDKLGSAIVLKDEAEFDIFTSATATMASYFAFGGTVADWMERHGIGHDMALAFVAQMFRGLAATGNGQGFAQLAEEHQTLGGINEQVVRHVAPDGAFTGLDAALDGVLARLRL